ncbi:nucleoside deaminase [Marinilabilia salmonicolor]|uniref:nucleoside deaminase n=1 Tax=Marinilabilia salmonicolor TaxID=989 RepID=UPI000299E045|nr:nucleoside deaminase [Marinilabilia salmonicolor]
MNAHKEYMKMAADLARENVLKGGGPFSAVIVKDGEVIATGCNRVTDKHDPTAHAEIEAIRKATKKLSTHDLSGCSIYASCEPCPMCLGAIYWARLDQLFFGNTRKDAASIGFDDEFIYHELEKPIDQRSIPTQQIVTENIKHAFEHWAKIDDKQEY